MVAASTARRRAAESDAWLAVNAAEMLAIHPFLPLHSELRSSRGEPEHHAPAQLIAVC